MKVDEIIQDCERAAGMAAKILLKMQGKTHVREKAPADLVTEADLASQQAIFTFLGQRYPDFGFLGEEQIDADPRHGSGDYCWIVDPLDGTTNYVHGLDNFCVSIALRHQKQVVLGVILDPVRNEKFTSIAGKGAFVNGQRLKTSDTSSLRQALIAASLPPQVARDSAEIKRLVNVLCECQSFRRMGSAALNLCYVAAGKLDGYWATSVKIWDVAAGVLMIQESQGIVTALDGGLFQLENPQLIAAGSPELHRDLLEVLNRNVSS
jgi:myo-inositol-1(or 4)-monophosphatase